MARFLSSKQSPIGKHITDEFPDTRTTFQIVGVSKDDRDHRLRGNIPRRFYIPFFQGLGGIPPAANFEIRTFADPNSACAPSAAKWSKWIASLPILSADRLSELLDRTLTQERLIAQLSAFFGALALLLARIGLYGCSPIPSRGAPTKSASAWPSVRSSVLGAGDGDARDAAGSRHRHRASVFRSAFALTRLVSSRLYGLKPTDPLTIVLAGRCWLRWRCCWLPAGPARGARGSAGRAALRVTRKIRFLPASGCCTITRRAGYENCNPAFTAAFLRGHLADIGLPSHQFGPPDDEGGQQFPEFADTRTDGPKPPTSSKTTSDSTGTSFPRSERTAVARNDGPAEANWRQRCSAPA